MSKCSPEPSWLANDNKLPPSEPEPPTHPDDHQTTWPILGSGSSRTEHEVLKAKAFSDQQQKLAFGGTAPKLVLFTDGSSLEPTIGGGGASVVCCHNTDEIFDAKNFSLGKAVSSFGSEVCAIEHALHWATAKLADSSAPHKVTVLSDCQQAVRLARYGDLGVGRSYWSYLDNINNLKGALRGANHKVMIDWIPGHTGCHLNAMADALAKTAATQSIGSIGSADCTTSFQRPFLLAKSFVRRRLNAWKAKVWLTSTKGRHLFEFHKNPNQHQPKNQRSLPRWAQVAFSRLRIGNATTNHSLSLVGKSDSANCENCESILDSPEHRVLSCPKYTSARRILTSSCGLSHPSELTMIGLLAPQGPTTQKQNTTAAFMLFLEKTNLRELFIWRPP